MGNDVLADQAFAATESLVASQIRSVFCVPLMVFQSKLGVIYADTTHAGAHFDEHHLHLLTAIASIAAVALEHARYVEWLEGENQRLQGSCAQRRPIRDQRQVPGPTCCRRTAGFAAR